MCYMLQCATRDEIWNLVITRNVNTFTFSHRNPSLITCWEKWLCAHTISALTIWNLLSNKGGAGAGGTPL